MVLTADRMIHGTGFNVTHKKPIILSASATAVRSIGPAFVLTPQFNLEFRFLHPPVPIWVIGSGKTAMDVMHRLATTVPGAADRIRCVGGRGTS